MNYIDEELIRLNSIKRTILLKEKIKKEKDKQYYLSYFKEYNKLIKYYNCTNCIEYEIQDNKQICRLHDSYISDITSCLDFEK